MRITTQQEYRLSIGQSQSRRKRIEGFVNAGNGSIYLKQQERFEGILQRVNESQNEVVVFSAEGFFQYIKPADLDKILEMCELRVILYTRDAIEMKISQWQQSIKGQDLFSTSTNM